MEMKEQTRNTYVEQEIKKNINVNVVKVSNVNKKRKIMIF